MIERRVHSVVLCDAGSALSRDVLACYKALCAACRDNRTRTLYDCFSFWCAVVVAVGSRELQKAKDFIEETSSDSAKPYGSYEEVLEDENVHGVYIPLPTSLHLEWVKKVADKGKHILLEKPIALVSHRRFRTAIVSTRTPEPDRAFICSLQWAIMYRPNTHHIPSF